MFIFSEIIPITKNSWRENIVHGKIINTISSIFLQQLFRILNIKMRSNSKTISSFSRQILFLFQDKICFEFLFLYN
jgi:hypothetical protein